jgi:hypothetical protein
MQLNHLSVSTVKKIVELSKLAKKANNEREKATTDGIGDITTTQEQKNLIEAVRALSPEQKKELCGLMWLGRDDDEDAKGFDKLVEETDRFRNEPIEQYMIEKPLDDYLSNGLCKLGYIK